MNYKDEEYGYNILEQIEHKMTIVRKNEWMNDGMVMDATNEDKHTEYTMQQ